MRLKQEESEKERIRNQLRREAEAKERREAEVIAIHRANGICQACRKPADVLIAFPSYNAVACACGHNFTEPEDFKILCSTCLKVANALWD